MVPASSTNRPSMTRVLVEYFGTFQPIYKHVCIKRGTDVDMDRLCPAGLNEDLLLVSGCLCPDGQQVLGFTPPKFQCVRYSACCSLLNSFQH